MTSAQCRKPRKGNKKNAHSDCTVLACECPCHFPVEQVAA